MAPPRMTDEQHAAAFWRQVDKTGSCWLFTGTLDWQGYAIARKGRMCNGERFRSLHRYAYTLLVGPIPPGMTLDHLCRVRNCVKPAHLEPVTARENIQRSNAPGVLANRTNRCHKGHSLDDAYINRTTGQRRCRPCDIEASRQKRARRRLRDQTHRRRIPMET